MAMAWLRMSCGLVLGGLLFLTACTQVLPTILPDLSLPQRKVLTSEEQQKAIEELSRKKETHEADAIKQIEQDKKH